MRRNRRALGLKELLPTALEPDGPPPLQRPHYTGRCSKPQGNMRRHSGWALIEAIQRARVGTWPDDVKDAIIARRCKQARNIAKVPPPVGC